MMMIVYYYFADVVKVALLLFIGGLEDAFRDVRFQVESTVVQPFFGDDVRGSFPIEQNESAFAAFSSLLR